MPSETKPNRDLAVIAKEIRAEGKKNIKSLARTGKLLQEAADQYPGEYLKWLEREVDYSDETALNYRKLYKLFQKPNAFGFEKMDISLRALYRIAALNDDEEQQAEVIRQVTEAGRLGHVTSDTVRDIINPPPPPPGDEEGEDDDDDDDEMEPPPDDGEGEDDEGEDDEGEDEDDDEDDEKPPADDKPPGVDKMVEALDAVAHFLSSDDVSRRAVKIFGPERVHEVIIGLQSLYDAHCKTSDVKKAADRAERGRAQH